MKDFASHLIITVGVTR